MVKEPLQVFHSLLEERENIFLFPFLNSGEDNLLASLALFFSLKNSGQKANLILGSLPWEAQPFISPEISFQPKIIIRPPASSQIEQLRYEKKQGQVIFYLETGDRILNPQDFDLLLSPEPQPDLLITIGAQKQEQVSHSLFQNFKNSRPIINIDYKNNNQQFGTLNLVRPQAVCLSHWLTTILRQLKNEEIDSVTAGYLLQAFKLLSAEKHNKESLAEMHSLMDEGGLNFTPPSPFFSSQAKIDFLQQVIKRLQFLKESGIAFLSLETGVWPSFSPPHLSALIKDLQTGLFHFSNLLLLWQTDSQTVQGIISFQDKEKQTYLQKTLAGKEQGKISLFRANQTNLSAVKSKILSLLSENKL
jgi:hypothetical protein